MIWILLLVSLPLAEMTLLVFVGQHIGLWSTLGWLIAAGVLGAGLAKQQGRRVFKEWQRALAESRVPEEGLVSGFFVLIGAGLLILPGFLSDVVGVFFLMPWSRKVMAQALRRLMTKRVAEGRVRVFTFRGPIQYRDRDDRQPPFDPKAFEPPSGRIIDVDPAK